MAEQINQQQQFEATDLMIKAVRRAVSDKLSTYYKKLIDNDCLELCLGYGTENDNRILDTLKELKLKTDNILDCKNGALKHCFFTINFQEGITPEEIVNVMRDFCQKCAYLKQADYVWSLEQRSEVQGEEHGFHVHICFTKDDNAPSKIQRAFKTKFFDKYVGNPNCLDYKYIDDPANKIKYILGYKDENKMAKVIIDRLYKKANGIRDYYSSGIQYGNIISQILIKMAETDSTVLPALPNGLTHSQILISQLEAEEDEARRESI